MQISKKPISQDVLSKLFILFYEIFREQMTQKDFIEVINEIFSLKEQVMIIKRIAVFYLVTKDVGVNDIAEKLRISSATASKFAKLTDEGKFLSEFFKKKVKKEKFFNLLEDLYREIISPPTKYGTDWAAGWKIEMERQKKKDQII